MTTELYGGWATFSSAPFGSLGQGVSHPSEQIKGKYAQASRTV